MRTITNYELRTTNYELRTTNYELRTENCELRTLFLLLRGRCGLGQVVVVHDGVEDQGVVADGFAAVDGVVGEEQDVALAEVGVYDNGVLGDGGGVVEETGEEHGLGVGESQDDVRPELRRDYGGVVAGLVFVELARLPRLLLMQGFGFDGLAALGLVTLFQSAAAGGALGVGVHEDAAAGTADGVGNVEGERAGTHDGQVGVVAVGNGRVFLNEDSVEDGADDASAFGGSDADAGSEAGVNGELCSVFAGDEEAAVPR